MAGLASVFRFLATVDFALHRIGWKSRRTRPGPALPGLLSLPDDPKLLPTHWKEASRTALMGGQGAADEVS